MAYSGCFNFGINEFENIREKQSLCYYCSSFSNRFKRVITAYAGDVKANTITLNGETYPLNDGHFPTIDLPAVVEELTTYAIPRLFNEKEQ